MTTLEKVVLAQEVVSSYPLSEVLQALELPRSTWYYQSTVRVEYAERYSELRPVLEQIAREHPEYGYRRTTTELRETHDRVVNEKVVRRLHRLWGLPLVRSTHPPRPSGVRTVITEAGDRANLVALLSEIRPLEVVYTDFTELRYAAGRYKAHLIVFPDHASKVVLGWSVGERAVTDLALDGWKRAVDFLAELGVSPEGIIVHHDRDPIFTSYDWTGQLLLRDRARLSYALARHRNRMRTKPARLRSLRSLSAGPRNRSDELRPLTHQPQMCGTSVGRPARGGHLRNPVDP